mmetsp:Transcript_4237/g.6693  ORF Transcript_4237/g.6693 Transcript_4237/m.6693 type:complete len:106 (-) Transcript_4237:517-834(-)
MLSAPRMVLNRWAMTIVVRQCSCRSLSIAAWTNPSLSASRAEVASSKSKSLGSFIKALAMAILCFCPPDSRTPFSPTAVSSPCSNFDMNSQALALIAAFLTFSSN